MSYRIQIVPSAKKSLKRLPLKAQQDVAKKIDELAEDPRHDGVIKLGGFEHYYRTHAGRNYVIVFTIEDADLLVLVIRVGNRDDIYKNLPKCPPPR